MITLKIKSERTGNEASFTFNDKGVLVKAESIAMASVSGWLTVLKMLPLTPQELEQYANDNKLLITDVPEDLSFDAFWSAYKYKIGHRVRVMKLWDALPDDERIKALQGIRHYEYYLQTNTGINKLYPETYISQKRYENFVK